VGKRKKPDLSTVIPDLVVYDYSAKRPSGKFEDLAQFAEAKISGKPLGKTVYLSIGYHARKNLLSITFKKAKSGEWLHVKVRVRQGVEYPQSLTVPTSTTSVGDKVAQVLMGERFIYNEERVLFENEQAVAAFGAGNGMFWALRTLKKIEGRLARTTRNVHGIEWEREFRIWQAKGKDLASVEPENIIGKRLMEVLAAG